MLELATFESGTSPAFGRGVRRADTVVTSAFLFANLRLAPTLLTAPCMSRQSPRYAPPNCVIEITARTVASQFLLRPSPELNRIVLGVIARALFLFPVKLHAVAFMSNHWHALLTPVDGRMLSRFVQHVHSNIARAVNSALRREGQVFRSASWVVVAADSELDRLRYVLSQGAKEGLVATPLEWPGVHSARALVGIEELAGSWGDRAVLSRARRNDAADLACPTTPPDTHQIELAPLPSMSGMTVDERRALVSDMLTAIEQSARSKTERPLGATRVLAQDPLSQPVDTKRSSAPLIHTKDPVMRKAFTLTRQCFTIELRAARERVRNGERTMLPPGCFPPIVPFQVSTASVLVTPVSSADTAFLVHEPRSAPAMQQGAGI